MKLFNIELKAFEAARMQIDKEKLQLIFTELQLKTNLIRCFVTKIINMENLNAAKKESHKIFAKGELKLQNP